MPTFVSLAAALGLEEPDIFISLLYRLERPARTRGKRGMMEAVDATSTFPFSRFVESVRFVARIDGRARRVDQLPDGRTTLVFRVIERGRRGDVTVVGPRTRALLKDATGFAHAVVFQF